MSYIDYAAFDPVFWLHHAMVDRCFAMWQVLHPGNYVIPDPATYNTFTSYASQTQDVNSPLDPFYKDTFGNFWTSAEVYSTETFGYAYAETSNSSTTNVTSQVNTAINNLYGPKTWSSKLRFRASESSLTPSTSIEWIANIRVKKYALNSPFFIHIFLGPFNPDPSSWPFEPSLVGTHFIFVKGASAIANSACNCDPDQMVSGTIPLTYALEELVSEGSLKSLDPEDVNQYLAQNLKYRVTLSDGTEISNEDVPSLKISVVSAEVQAPSSDADLPMWGEVEEQMDVSTG
jgi:tyrosinase